MVLPRPRSCPLKNSEIISVSCGNVSFVFFSPVSYPVISVGEKLLSWSSLGLFVKSAEKKVSRSQRMVLKTQPMLSPAQRLQPNAHVLGEKGERGNAPILESSVVVLRKRGRSLGVKWWRIVRRSCSVGPPLASRSMLSNKNKNPVKILEENFKILTTTAWRSEISIGGKKTTNSEE